MSSAEAMVDETVVSPSASGQGRDATRSAAVLAALAVTQMTWLAAIVYGAIWLLT